MKHYDIWVNPIPKPRMTRADRWKKRACVLRYFVFKDAIQDVFPYDKLEISKGFGIKFVIPMPKSWSKKKRVEMDGKPHLQRPDLDNYLKALFDSAFEEDSHVWKLLGLEKVWGPRGKIVLYQ